MDENFVLKWSGNGMVPYMWCIHDTYYMNKIIPCLDFKVVGTTTFCCSWWLWWWFGIHAHATFKMSTFFVIALQCRLTRVFYCCKKWMNFMQTFKNLFIQLPQIFFCSYWRLRTIFALSINEFVCFLWFCRAKLW